MGRCARRPSFRSFNVFFSDSETVSSIVVVFVEPAGAVVVMVGGRCAFACACAAATAAGACDSHGAAEGLFSSDVDGVNEDAVGFIAVAGVSRGVIRSKRLPP